MKVEKFLGFFVFYESDYFRVVLKVKTTIV